MSSLGCGLVWGVSCRPLDYFSGEAGSDTGPEEEQDSGQVHSDPDLDDGKSPDLARLNFQPLPPELEVAIGGLGGGGGAAAGGRSYNPNRFCLHFEKESNEEIERRKHLAKTTPITPVPEVKSRNKNFSLLYGLRWSRGI